jgi:hypothetical protein
MKECCAVGTNLEAMYQEQTVGASLCVQFGCIKRTKTTLVQARHNSSSLTNP